MQEFSDRRKVFRTLHESGCFVLPNPWDKGSAYCLMNMGYKALATTSAGFAFTIAKPDSVAVLSLEEVLQHTAEVVRATDLPVNADFQSGYASTADGVAESVAKCVATGVAGLSIEDSTGDAARPLFDLDEAVDRVRAARHAIDASGADVLLTARAECFLVDHPDALSESVRRLAAYAEAGADVLYSPGPERTEEITAIVDVAAGLPVNVLMCKHTGLSVGDLANLGVRRISVGSALARAAWGGFLSSAHEILADGTFTGLDSAASFEELNGIFEK